MRKNLPIYPTNAVFVVHDTQRIDVMKSIIIGSEDTPYAHGVYLFDIFFDDNYPIYPPKVTLMTTGQGCVRFSKIIAIFLFI
jgi:ubiquitin-protein ligase